MRVKRVLDTLARSVQLLDERRDEHAALLDVRRSVQVTTFTCGSESAYMVLRFHGKARSMNAVRRALDTDRDGTSTASLLQLFRRRGLKPVIRARATLDDLRRGIVDGAPSIVSLDEASHWGVVYGVSATRVYLADPSLLRSFRVAVPTDRFLERWDCWAMTVRRR